MNNILASLIDEGGMRVGSMPEANRDYDSHSEGETSIGRSLKEDRLYTQVQSSAATLRLLHSDTDWVKISSLC